MSCTLLVPDPVLKVGINRVTGRRVSVLSEAFKAEIDHQSAGIWEASDDSDDSECSETSHASSFVDIRASRNKSALTALFSVANVDRADNEHPDSWQGGAWEEPDDDNTGNTGNKGTDNGPTHQVLRDKKGRRVSVLNESVLNSANTNNGQWGGFDSDEESDGEKSRVSSMASNHSDALHSSRNNSRSTSTTTTTFKGNKQSKAIPEGEEGEAHISPKKSIASTMSEFISKRRNSLF